MSAHARRDYTSPSFYQDQKLGQPLGFFTKLVFSSPCTKSFLSHWVGSVFHAPSPSASLTRAHGQGALGNRGVPGVVASHGGSPGPSHCLGEERVHRSSDCECRPLPGGITSRGGQMGAGSGGQGGGSMPSSPERAHHGGHCGLARPSEVQSREGLASPFKPPGLQRALASPTEKEGDKVPNCV